MKKEEIKVLVADDHDLIRQGLKRIISFEEDLVITGEAKDGKETLKMLRKYNSDVVLLDVNMPFISGIEVLEKVKKQNDSIKAIMLTVESDKKFIHKAIDIGADGYVLKDSASMEIVDAIRTVYYGDKYIDKSLVSILFSNIKDNRTIKTSILDNLSQREVEVLMNICKGLSNKEIGEKLYLSEKTVKNYITSLFRKINVNDRVKAAIIGIENDIDIYYKARFKVKK
ncbi:response regulator [Haloimpatiens sp. FM7330]|uniref:response regulator n=1 Tax=Haloimpatiens sp. FM7330 TaxID=3298610 RepID=UPI00362985C3